MPTPDIQSFLSVSTAAFDPILHVCGSGRVTHIHLNDEDLGVSRDSFSYSNERVRDFFF